MTDRQSVVPGGRPGVPRRAARAARRGPDRRRDLLDAARRRFLADGYERTSVASIVREAGVAQGTFYLYFRSKEQLLLRLRGEVLATYLEAFRTASAGDAPADERLLAGLDRLGREMKRLHPLLRVFRAAASGAETQRVRLEGREALAAPLADLIAAGQADGSFQVDDPRMAAHLVLALLDDLLYEALEYDRPASGRETLAHAVRFLLRALGARPARLDRLAPPRKPAARGRVRRTR